MAGAGDGGGGVSDAAAADGRQLLLCSCAWAATQDDVPEAGDGDPRLPPGPCLAATPSLLSDRKPALAADGSGTEGWRPRDGPEAPWTRRPGTETGQGTGERGSIF